MAPRRTGQIDWLVVGVWGICCSVPPILWLSIMFIIEHWGATSPATDIAFGSGLLALWTTTLSLASAMSVKWTQSLWRLLLIPGSLGMAATVLVCRPSTIAEWWWMWWLVGFGIGQVAYIVLSAVPRAIVCAVLFALGFLLCLSLLFGWSVAPDGPHYRPTDFAGAAALACLVIAPYPPIRPTTGRNS